jgi:DNA (cytosine-5)-methyltransferase 1
MGLAYYNENDPRAAEWLRELIRAGLIAAGDVDDRSIVDVGAKDVAGYSQCHWFAGIGGWSYALRLAGWPDDKPVWTGSCPCQPFSVAGNRKATRDERHLWPIFARLIGECGPATVFGEQVASRLGREWLAGVLLDLEALGYACAGADLCAAGVSAPHIRQRLYWVAQSRQQPARWGVCGRTEDPRADGGKTPDKPGGSGDPCGLADSNGVELCGESPAGQQSVDEQDCRVAGGMGDATHRQNHKRRPGGVAEAACGGECSNHAIGSTGSVGWLDFDVIPCGDGKARRIESGSFPLVDGFPERVGLLRGYGNAIVPELAAEFVRAYLGWRGQ